MIGIGSHVSIEKGKPGLAIVQGVSTDLRIFEVDAGGAL